MKAKVVGVSAWQGVPTGGVLDIELRERYVDSEGNATVSHYSATLDPAARKWLEPQTKGDLWLVVQGPDDPPGPRATFREVLYYESGFSVTTSFGRTLVSSDLEGLTFDYAEPQPGLPTGFGDAPLTMKAAQKLLAEGDALIKAQKQALADTAQAQAEWATTPRTLLNGTVAERRALVVDPPRRVIFFENDTRRQINYFPGVGWRDVYGNDPDAAPPPPDTGVY